MPSQHPKSHFALEELKPRVLLSANLGAVALGAAFQSSGHHLAMVEESIAHPLGSHHVQDGIDVFEGISGGAALTSPDTPATNAPSAPATSPLQETAPAQPADSTDNARSVTPAIQTKVRASTTHSAVQTPVTAASCRCHFWHFHLAIRGDDCQPIGDQFNSRRAPPPVVMPQTQPNDGTANL